MIATWSMRTLSESQTRTEERTTTLPRLFKRLDQKRAVRRTEPKADVTCRKAVTLRTMILKTKLEFWSMNRLTKKSRKCSLNKKTKYILHSLLDIKLVIQKFNSKVGSKCNPEIYEQQKC